MRRLLWRWTAVPVLNAGVTPAQAEDGYELWLRYRKPAFEQAWRDVPTGQYVTAEKAADPTIKAAVDELNRALQAAIGEDLSRHGPAWGKGAGASAGILIGTPRSPRIATLELPLNRVGDEGFVLRRVQIDGRSTIVVAANRPVGCCTGLWRCCAESARTSRSPGWMSSSVRGSSCASSTTGTTSIAMSSAVMPVSRSGTGGGCPMCVTRATSITRAPTPRLRPDAIGEQRGGAICAAGRAPLRRSGHNR